MSHDFLPKTVPGQLTSFRGRGSVLYRGPEEMRAAGIGFAQPGIDAREWTKSVVQLYHEPIMKDLRAALRKGMASCVEEPGAPPAERP